MEQAEIDKLSNFFRKTDPLEPRNDRSLQREQPRSSSKDNFREFVSAEKTKNAFDLLQQQKKLQKKKPHKYNPYAFNKLSDKQKRQTFLSLYEELIVCKQKLNDEIQKGKQLNTKLHLIETQFSNTKKLSELTPPERLRIEKEKDEEYLQLKNQNRRLIQKLSSLELPKRIAKKHQTVLPKKPQKTIHAVNQGVLADLENERNTVKQLLNMIECLKKDRNSLEEQLKEKQRAGSLNNNSSVIRRPDKPKNNDNTFNQNLMQENVLMKQKIANLQYNYQKLSLSSSEKINELSEQLREERQKIVKKERQYNNRVKQYGQSNLEQRVIELQREKSKYEDQIRRMVSLPFYSNNKETLDLQTKIRDMEQKIKIKDTELNTLRDSNTKLITEIDFKKRENNILKEENKNIKKENLSLKEKQLNKGGGQIMVNNQDYYRKALNLNKWEGDDPIWKKYSTLAKPELEILNINELKKLADKLWLEKLELLAHLEKAHNKMKAESDEKNSRFKYLENEKEKLESKLETAVKKIDEYAAILSMKRGHTTQVYEQNGVKYDDTVSVFEVDEQDILGMDANQNYFDLYIGEMVLQDVAISQQAKGSIRDIKNLISFLTLDFYNHDTEHTTFAEGLRYDFKNKFSFKVEANQYFIHYLQKDSLKLELWGSQGSSAPLLGTGNIYLKDLIIKSQDGVSSVVHSKCTLYSSDKQLLGVVDYRIRMRLPLSPFLKWLKQKKEFNTDKKAFEDIEPSPKHRRLSITIERALNLTDDIEAFVYFELQNQDCYTQPEKGPSPLWDYHKELQIIFDEEFEMNLKKKYVQFTVFDDRKPMGEDVYGIAKVNLTPLLTNNYMELKADIKNIKNQKLGILAMKLAWL